MGGYCSKRSEFGCSSGKDLGVGMQTDACLGEVNWTEGGLVDF